MIAGRPESGAIESHPQPSLLIFCHEAPVLRRSYRSNHWFCTPVGDDRELSLDTVLCRLWIVCGQLNSIYEV
jgi:hypothetical protein